MDSQITCNCVADSGGAVRCTDWLDVRRTHLDLFSGIGGFALAANAAGYKTIGFSEIEPYACKILKRHWPDVPNYGDIRNIRGVRCELLTGGFPCQPFSVAGHRRGSKDDRHLWPEMCRVIAEARPTWVLGENVPGIVAMELDGVLSDLENIGYACWPFIIPALAVDARHRRDRVWIVAHAAGERGKKTTNGCQPGISMPVLGGEESSPLADADETGRREQCRTKPMGAEHAAAECGCEDVGHTMREGSHAGAQTGIHRREESPGPRHGNSERPSRWPTEPGMGRVANGIPNRAHRIQGLGNAIVPQVAETLIRMMARTSNSVITNQVAKATNANDLDKKT